MVNIKLHKNNHCWFKDTINTPSLKNIVVAIITRLAFNPSSPLFHKNQYLEECSYGTTCTVIFHSFSKSQKMCCRWPQEQTQQRWSKTRKGAVWFNLWMFTARASCKKFVIRISTNDGGKVSLELVFLSSAQPVTAAWEHLLLLWFENPQASWLLPSAQTRRADLAAQNHPSLTAMHLLCSAGRSARAAQTSCWSLRMLTKAPPNESCPDYKLVCQLGANSSHSDG